MWADESVVYRTGEGRIRLPFGQIAFFAKTYGLNPDKGEARALSNMSDFISTVSVVCHRLHSNLMKFKPGTIAEADFQSLHVDTQSFFLFVQQYLEDLALATRLCLDPSERHQMPANFSKFAKRLAATLPRKTPFGAFLAQEMVYFQEIKDIRDDICHRTAFGRARSAVFPDFGSLMQTAAGKAAFVSGNDLRGYLSRCLGNVLSLACLCNDYVVETLTRRFPTWKTINLPAFLAPAGEIDFGVRSPKPLFGLGTMIMMIPRDLYDSLEYFLVDGG